MRVDQGSVFTSQKWQQITEAAGIFLHLSGVESHNSIGLGERYHAPLRRIFKKVRYDAPKFNPHLALRLAQNVMNDTVGAKGIVPSLSVFGIVPRFPAAGASLPTHRERMTTIESARREMEVVTAELRIRQALLSRVPPASKYVIARATSSVFIERETSASSVHSQSCESSTSKSGLHGTHGQDPRSL